MTAKHEQAREEIKARILEAVEVDRRVIGCLEYRPPNYEGGVQGSDLTLALIIREKHLAAFESKWAAWAAQFGELYLAYTSCTGHLRAIYERGDIPFSVAFSFKSDASIPDLKSRPISPSDPKQIILYDGTGGELAVTVSQRTSQSLAPPDLQAVFTQVCCDFWNMLLGCHTRLLQGQFWAVRNDYHALVLGNLLSLLRLQYGTIDKWLAFHPADGIEQDLNQEDLARLKRCIPDPDDRDLERAMRESAEFGAQTCSKIHQVYNWKWPQRVAQQTLALLSPGPAELSGLPPLTVKPIGIVHNRVEDLLSPNEIKSVPSRIIIDPALSAGLDGLTGDQRLLVIFQFHKLSGFELHQHPKNNPQLPKKGVFALHSPLRPNPIGVTEVDLIRREENILHVRGLDAVNGTPVLDLKLNERSDKAGGCQKY